MASMRFLVIGVAAERGRPEVPPAGGRLPASDQPDPSMNSPWGTPAARAISGSTGTR